MKTIRQIADEIGVSKQAVFKKIKREPLSTSLQGLTATVDGRLMVEVDGEKLIKQAFYENAPSTTDNQLTGAVDGLVDGASTKNEEKTVAVDGVISVLQATIDMLQGQLEVKDRQIEQQAQTIIRLTDALAAAQQTAAAAQALHAGTIQQQLLTGEAGADQQGFESLGRKQTEWRAWMEREKASLAEIAQAHEFEIVSLGGGRPHMDLPEYRAAAQRLEAVQEQVTAAEQDMAVLEQQKKALGKTVRRLQAAESVRVDLDAIRPEKTLTGAVKGVTVEQIKELKAAAIRGAAAEQEVRELKAENKQLHSRLPSMKEKLKEAQERQELISENRDLRQQVAYLEDSLDSERNFSSRLLEGVGAVLDFLDRHLPEQFRPLVERARELLPVPELQQPEQEQERGHTWGGMEL